MIQKCLYCHSKKVITWGGFQTVSVGIWRLSNCESRDNFAENHEMG